MSVARHAERAVEVAVQILSGIGLPVDQFQLFSVEIVKDCALSTGDKHQVQKIVSAHLANIQALSRQAVTGRKVMF